MMSQLSRSSSPSNTKMKASTGTRSDNKMEKPRLYLEHTCYICGNIMSSAKQTINHVDRIHGYELPSREVGRKRPQDNEFEYLRDKMAEKDMSHYACPSCWFHCSEDDLEVLNRHTRDEHNPLKVDMTKDDDLTSTRPRNRSNSILSNRSNTSGNRRSRSNSVSNNNRQSLGTLPPSEVGELGEKLDELINLFKKFFNQQE